jgi:hypothetical protein
MILALPPGGQGPRAFRCLDCAQPDPLKSEHVSAWLKGELGSQKLNRMPPSFAGSCLRVERGFKATVVLPVSFRQGGSASQIETIVRAKRDAA